MMDEPEASLGERVLLLPPTARDGFASVRLLAAAGIACLPCRNTAEVCEEASRGAAALVLAEEAVLADDSSCIHDLLSRQPSWSDLPVVVLTAAGRTSDRRLRSLLELGDVTIARRPLDVAEFVAVVRAALRDRRRQYLVRDHVAAIERQSEALVEADRRKDEFLAMLAHELRNPLAPIRNGLEIMKAQSGQAPAFTSIRQMISRQVDQLSRLVDDLLDVSRITRGVVELRRKTVDLSELASRAVEATRSLFDARGQRISVTTPGRPVVVDADPVRMMQVIANLLNNASRYSEDGASVYLAVEQEGGDALVRVRDEGIGIAPGKLPLVFDLFTQIDRSLDRSQGGLGIGLTLVRSLVELHGGRATAFSEGLGKGSEFVIAIPVAPLPGSAAAVDSDLFRSPAHSRRILVVDDNVDAADSLAVLLRIYGHEVRTANHGLKGVELAQQFEPDVAVLDIGLPGIDGYELASRMRREPRSRPLTLVALTGYGQESDRMRTREAGFDHHLTKPADLTMLLEVVQTSADRH